MKTKILLFALSLLCLTSFAQSPYPIPNIDFISYPPPSTSREVADNIPTALDIANNGAYIAGHTKTGASLQDFILLKYDTVGNFKWKKTYDKAGLDDRIFDIAVDNSGNVYVTGGSQDITSGFDIATIKYDLNGNQIWIARYNGGGNSDDKGFSIATDGSNVFVCGYSSSATTGKDFTVIKYNSLGVQQYVYTKNGTANGDDVANSLVWQSNKLYVTGNLKNTTTNQDIYTTRLNAINGNVDWSQTFNGTANLDDQSLDIKLNGNDVLICGGITNTGTNQDYHLARLNSNNGSIVFSKPYDAFGGNDFATSLIFNASSTYAIVGLVQNGMNYDYHTVKYNNAGIFSWVHKLQRGTGFSAVLPKIAVDILGDFYICGASQNNGSLDGVLYQLAPSGNQAWIDYQDGFGLRDAHVDLSTDNLGHVYLASLNERLTNVFDIALIRYSQTPVYAPIDFNNVNEAFSMAHLFYPNSGEIIDLSRTQVPNVSFYTKFTNRSEFIVKEKGVKVAFCEFKSDTAKVNPQDTVVRVDMEFTNASDFLKIYPFDIQNKAVLNYFMEYLPTNGITDVKGASRLMVPNVYPNIDLHFYSNNQGYKYYFVVKPTGNPSDIQLNFSGAKSTSIVSNRLQIDNGLSTFGFRKPDIYNVTFALTTPSVTGTSGWVSLGGDKYGFNVGTYNPILPLVIEFDNAKAAGASPTIIGNLDWSTYLGGSSTDEIKDVKIDGASNLYAVGKTASSPFPNPGVTPFQPFIAGVSDAFVAKFTNIGSGVGVPAWSTYVGGNLTDFFNSLDVDPISGDIYCVGATNSYSLNLIPKLGGATNSAWVGPYSGGIGGFGYMYDGLVFQIKPAGNTSSWLTYYGGNSTDEFTKCKFDATGNLFVTGLTCSTNASVIATGSQYSRAYLNTGTTFTDLVEDGYIVKYNPNSTVVWATTIGASVGTTGYFSNDELLDLTFDASGDVYVTGYTEGSDYIVTGGGVANHSNSSADGVVTRFANNGTIKFSTHIGGTDYDKAFGITTNTLVGSNVYVSGFASVGLTTVNSGNYYHTATHKGGPYDVLFAVYNSANSLIHSTYIGGTNDEEAMDIEVDDYGFIHISGITISTNFYAPVSNSLGYNFTPAGVGGYDLFIVTLKGGYPDVVWTGIIGSDKNEVGLFNYSKAEITVDNSIETLYLGAKTDKQTATKYPIVGTAPTYTQSSNGTNDGCISRFQLGIIHRSAISVQEIKDLNNGISIYPNPTNSYLNVKISNLKENYSYIIYNSIGQLVLSGKITVLNSIIDVNVLKTGMYFIEITDGTNKTISKFVKHE